MAQRVTVALEDDLDGDPAAETVRFGFGGADYEMDLRTAAARQRSGDVRSWAKARGIALSGRGRIPASVVAQYHAAANGN
jgi:hypothetical protein